MCEANSLHADYSNLIKNFILMSNLGLTQAVMHFKVFGIRHGDYFHY